MKNLFLLLFCLTVFIACDNDDDHTSQNPIDQLPEATQTGRGIFACLVNGEPFIANNAYFNCYYQYVDGGYYFGIAGENEDFKKPSLITIALDNIDIIPHNIYIIKEHSASGAWGGGAFDLDINNSESSFTDENFQGKIIFTKLNIEEYIVSGTFEIDLEDPFTGDTIRIREGRFDTLFVP